VAAVESVSPRDPATGQEQPPDVERTILRGDFRTVLEPALLAALAADRDGDALRGVLVVVPTNLVRVRLRRRFAEVSAHLGVRFESLDSLASQFALPALAREGLAPLPPLGGRLLASQVARDLPADSYYAALRDRDGFAAALAATLRDVEDAGVHTAELTAFAARSRSPRLASFAQAASEYAQRLATAACASGAMVFARAAEAASRRELPPALAGLERIHFYGFYDLTGVQQRFAQALLSLAPARVYTPIPEGPGGAFGARFLVWLEARGFRPARRPVPDSHSPGRALDVLRDRMFAPGPFARAASADGSVRWLASATRGDEARDALRQVAALAEEGIPLNEIAVLHRHGREAARVAAAASAVERGLGDTATLPRFVAGGTSLARRGELRALLLLALTLERSLPRRDVFAFLEETGAVPRAAAWSRLANEAGVIGGRDPEEWQQRLERLDRRTRARLAAGIGSREDDEEGEEIESAVARDSAKSLASDLDDLAVLRRKIEDLARRQASYAAARTFREAAEALEAAYAAHGDARGTAPVDPAIHEFLAGIAALDALGLPSEPGVFRALLEAAADDAAEPCGRFEAGFFVGGVLAARGLAFRAIVMTGLEDAVFPRRARQDPILDDDERRQLSRELLLPNEPGIPTSDRAAAEERLLFSLVISAASDVIVFSCPLREDASETEVLPSLLYRQSAECLLDAAPRDSRAGLESLLAPFAARISQAPLDLREYDVERTVVLAGRGDAAALRFLSEADPRLAAALRGERDRGRERRFTAFDAHVDPRVAGAAITAALRTAASPTRLEQYAHCPFAWFSSQVLGVDERVPLEEEALDFRDRGRVFHAALHTFVAGLLASGERFPLDPAARGLLRPVLQDAGRKEFDRVAAESAAPRVLLDAERARLADDLDAFLDAEFAASRSAIPASLEARFGESDLPPLELDIDGEKIAFRGSIDRIDRDPGTGDAIVIDYKSGAPIRVDRQEGGADVITSLAGGRRLQLPIYALVAERMLGGNGRVAAAEYYFCATRGKGKRIPALPSLWDAAGRRELESTIAVLRGAIRDGLFFADPSEENYCKRCAFSLACGLGAGLAERFERKQGDPAAAELLRLRAGPEREDPAGSEEDGEGGEA
jgi:ATP-dependent helicase/nuclease subunit B